MGRGRAATFGDARSAAPGPVSVAAAATYAALDLGTNNCRLLVARPDGRDGFRVVDAYSRIVRLGAGLDRTGRLGEAAMLRTLEALRVCASKIARNRVTAGRYVATEACRRASNCDEFFGRVAAETGLRLQTITPEEEARLALAGCVPLLDPAQEYALVFDIGGGSTELIWTRIAPGAEPKIVAWISVPCGVVTLAERHGGRDPGPDAFAAMIAEVAGHLLPLEDLHSIARAFAGGAAQMVGISGTITTLAAVGLGLPRYDRDQVDGRWVSNAEVTAVSHRLASMSYEERIAHPCIRKGRADLVIPGCAALQAILRVWPAEQVRVADRGLREGILRYLMGPGARVAAVPGPVPAA